ncbi:MAG: histidine--tRNA ligase [Sporomusaceae bacterium]|jgi:histidyl-tRNA synthetase|nr:histidine--tRNA ligase [Sporomusaceae bacterium]
MLITAPPGTKDLLPEKSAIWQRLEATIREVCRQAAYQEIRTPIFEQTELFARGIGETSDIVEKEMYTFTDRGNRSLTLRPEGTASTVRAYLENKLYAAALNPLKVYYIGPMFRCEKPQAGRFHQFHQFGVEALGSQRAALDAEIISLALLFFQRLGLQDLILHLNSVGCPTCRPRYRQELQAFFRDKFSKLCPNCQSRFERNPLRILDCKNKECSKLAQGAPEMLNSLCDECGTHFTQLKSLLKTAGLEFQINPRLVRGLDYYTKTAFEIQYPPLGAQSAICGGGRYDGLVAECGGENTPAIGFAIGLERTLIALEKQNALPSAAISLDVFLAPLTPEATEMAFKLLYELRQNKISADMDYLGRSLKAQLRYANKYPAKYVAVIGEEELAAGQVNLKNMSTGEQEAVGAAKLKDFLLGTLGEENFL